ncbi:methyl-accepting chemotaxis protein [Aerosakkonema sp. BLCC-F183]|uniref:methyl-accepting chemotaxis protein n=1 Tax=Aerosakkonema sp. BLCC-F183 TaxID=3342834 RepID=UPI0035B88FC4
MGLRRQIVLTVISAIAATLLPTVTIMTWTAREALLEKTNADGIRIAKLFALSAQFTKDIPDRVEESIADQMVGQAVIAAHLVSIAERAGLSPQAINAHLKAITDASIVDEFWITDEKGHSYLRNLDVDFTFSPDPKKQPQASLFWPLLTGEKTLVIQEARRREIDRNIFKYVGVVGIDKPRIVQVGSNGALFDRLRQELGFQNLIDRVLDKNSVHGIWVVDDRLNVVAAGTVTGLENSQSLNEADRALIERAMRQKLSQSERQGKYLRVATPLSDSDRQSLGATLIYLPLESVQKTIQQQLARAVAIATVTLIFGLLVSYILSRWLMQPIQELNEAAKAITQGNLDTMIKVHRTDELGQLAQVFTQMAQTVKVREQQLASVIDQAKQVAIENTLSTTQIAAAGKQLEATVVQQAAFVNQVNTTARAIAKTSGQLVKTMENVTQKATTTAQVTSSSQKSLREMADAMGDLASATNVISARLRVMNEKANNINSAVNRISEVAYKTNLISLNAAIEAEKAGESGAGFAVVAREVRRLADNSATASQEIEEVVKEIQSSVYKGVMEMDKFSHQVGYHVELVGRISQQITQAIEQVQSLTPEFEQVSQTVEAQFEGAQQISVAISKLSQASQQTVASLQQTNQVLDKLDDTAQVLRGIISSSVAS